MSCFQDSQPVRRKKTTTKNQQLTTKHDRAHKRNAPRSGNSEARNSTKASRRSGDARNLWQNHPPRSTRRCRISAPNRRFGAHLRSTAHTGHCGGRGASWAAGMAPRVVVGGNAALAPAPTGSTGTRRVDGIRRRSARPWAVSGGGSGCHLPLLTAHPACTAGRVGHVGRSRRFTICHPLHHSFLRNQEDNDLRALRDTNTRVRAHGGERDADVERDRECSIAEGRMD